MCIYSYVVDQKFDEWEKYLNKHKDVNPMPLPYIPIPQLPSQEEINEFHELLRRARKYDKKHNEPDCEVEEKKEKLRKLAQELGITIDFPEDE